ncbi:unnamed protein product, partial [Polarella glacialis]
VARKGVVPHFGTLAAAVVKRGVAASGAGGAEAEGLEQAIDAPLRMLFQQQLQTLLVRAADRYDEEMTARPNPMEARRAAEEMFLRGARDLVRPFSDWRYEAEHQDLLSRLLQSFGQDLQLVTEQGKQGQGKHVTIEVIRKLQEQGAGVQREAETRGAFPWNVKWQYMVENSPLGFRGQYNQGRSVVELLLMPSPDPRLKKNLLNRLGFVVTRPTSDCEGYYRTVIYGCLEVMLADESPKRIEQLLETFKKVSYKNAKEQNAHEQMLKIIRSFEDQEQLELWVSQDLILDQALIRACRQLVRMFLMQRAHEQSPSGLTYEQLVRALDSTYSSMEDFCRLVVDPLGRDAETLALDALPQMLGIGLRLWILDRRDEVGLVSLDTPGPAGQV